MVTKAWNVYGRTGHRQRASFGESYRVGGYDISGHFCTVDLLAEDVTNSNSYAVMVITADTAERCMDKFIGQLSDGVFENCRVGKIEEITVEDLIGIYAESVKREWLRTWCEGSGEYGTLAFEITEAIFAFDPYCGCDIGDVFSGNLDMLNEGRFKETADDLRMVVYEDRTEEGEALLRIASEIELIPVWDAIVNLMDDTIREEVHNEYAPCSNLEFLTEYCKRDRRFADLVWREFWIGVDVG